VITKEYTVKNKLVKNKKKHTTHSNVQS